MEVHSFENIDQKVKRRYTLKTFCFIMLMFNNFYLLYFNTDLLNNYVTQIDHMRNFIGSITTSNLVSRTFFEKNSRVIDRRGGQTLSVHCSDERTAVGYRAIWL